MFLAKKITNTFPRKSKPSYPQTTRAEPKYFLSKTRLNQQNHSRTKQENFVPAAGSAAPNTKIQTLTLSGSCTSRQAHPKISLLHRPGKVTAQAVTAHLAGWHICLLKSPAVLWLNPSLKGSNTGKLLWGGPRAPAPGGTLLCRPHWALALALRGAHPSAGRPCCTHLWGQCPFREL